jgi:hypothetical protein
VHQNPDAAHAFASLRARRERPTGHLAAGSKADDDVHPPRWIGLRESDTRDSRQRGSARGQMQKSYGVAGSWRFIVLAAWQAHREYRALARLARHSHVPAHHARELARDPRSA